VKVIDWCVVGLYFALMLAVGLFFTRRASRSVADYFVSGRNLSWWLIALSAVATYTDAGLAPAVTMLTYQGGLLGNAVWWIPYVIWMPLGAVLWSKYWRRLGTVTSAEMLEIRYSGRLAHAYRGIYAVFMSLGFIVLLMGYVSGWLGAALGPILGWEPARLMLFAGTIAAIYTATSGLYGVAYTDALQFGIFLLGNIILVPIALAATGGLSSVYHSIESMRGADAASFFRLTLPAPGLDGLTIFAFVVQGLFFAASPTGGEGFTAQRFMAARNEFHAQVGQLFNTLLTLIVRVVPFLFLGMIAAALYAPQSIAEPGELWARLVRAYAPTGLLGLLVAGVFAAYMSTISTEMNWGASYLVNDLYRAFLCPGKTERHYVRVGRAGSVLIFALSLLVAYFFVNGLRAWFLFINSVVFAFILPLSWLRFFWWRLNIYGEAAALVIGLPLSYAVWFPLGFSKEAIHPFWHGFLLLFGLGVIVIITVSFLTPPERVETLREFYTRCKPPGLWGPVTTSIDVRERAVIRADTLRDLFDCALGIAFATSAILSVVSAMGRQWGLLGMVCIVLCVSGGLFIGRWARRGVFRSMRSGSMIFVAALLIPICGGATSPDRTITEPYTWRENFQGTELGQFASYPPVQDVGYDPSLVPTSEYGALGGRSLMRILKPVRRGPERFGFIRRLDLVASSSGVLSFAYRLSTASFGDRIEVGIAAANGRRYTTTRGAGIGGSWHRVRLSIQELRDESRLLLPNGVGIEGFYVVASLARANLDITYRLLIDDVEFQEERETRFRVLQPQAIALEPRRELFATTNLGVERSLRVEVVAPVRLGSVECVVKDQDGKTSGRAELKERNGVWSNDVPFDRPHSPGIYALLLRGKTPGGRPLVTTVRIVRSSSPPAGHPRLYFSAADRKRLSERTREKKYEALWKQIVHQAEESRKNGDLSRASAIFPMLDRTYLLPTLPGYFDLITKAGTRVRYNALLAYINNDPEARDAVRNALQAAMKWPSWAPSWFSANGQPTYYPAGEFTAQIAFAYDLLYDQLSPQERAAIREGLIQKGIEPAYREYVLDNRVLSNTSNWISHSVAGSLLAAAAIAGDGDNPDLDLYINGLLSKLEGHLAGSYLPDGSYGEGISYHEFDMETLAPALVALKRVFGLDYWSHSYVKDSLWYPISTLTDPTAGCLDMGDTHCPAGHTIAPVVAQSHNPVFRWYEDHFAPTSMEDFLFSDDTLKAEPPKAPGSRYFSTKGDVVFRTGWGPDDAILLIRAGPNFNHNHADQGSFLLRALGEDLITDAGYADYYKDPYYDNYFKQAAGHNTVLVDGDAASQSIADTMTFQSLHEYPRIIDTVMSAGIDGVTSELQQVYCGLLKRFVRRIVFVKPDYVIVYDELVPSRPTSFDWLLHLPDASRVTTERATALYSGSTASLAVRFLSPDVKLRMYDGHLPYTTFNPSAPAAVPAQPAILNARTFQSSEPVRFLTALAPARSSEAARARTTDLRRIETPDWLGVERIRERLLFRKGSAAQPVSFDTWTTDAAAWFVRGEPGRPQLLAALGVTNLKRGNETWFASERASSFAATYQNGHTLLDVYSTVAQTVRVREPNGRTAEVRVEPGSHQLDFTGERPQ